MAWVAKLGSTLLVPSGGGNHLFIVCSDPMNFPGRPLASCLLINVSSVMPKCDQTLILNPGDHPFIAHPSFVYYGKARVETAADLEQRVANHVYQGHTDAARLLVRRIVANMDASLFTSGDMRKVAKDVWNTTIW